MDFWWAGQGSNLRHPVCKTGALPTELPAHVMFWYPERDSNPCYRCERPVSLAARGSGHGEGAPYGTFTRVVGPLERSAVRTTGFEPATPGSQIRCSPKLSYVLMPVATQRCVATGVVCSLRPAAGLSSCN